MVTVKEAIEKALLHGESKYRLSKNLKVQPITIDKWLNQDIKTMRAECADKLNFLYRVKIDDLFINNRGH